METVYPRMKSEFEGDSILSSDKGLPFFLTLSRGLKTGVPADDFLHPEANSKISHDSLTETQYFGICMPEERIHGLMYMWHHPNLKTVSGGVWIWRGIKPLAQECEIYDWRSFMSDSVLSNDLRSFRLDNGYGVEVIEPLKRHHVTYSDPSAGNSVDLEYTAVAPPVLWADGNHFEQTMKVRGAISLRGKAYKVDGYNVRDRSWGRARPEAHMKIPPVIWMTGVFNDDFHFNCTAADDPQLEPDWSGLYPDFTSERSLMGGWVTKDGVLSELVSCRKKTYRNAQTFIPERVEFTMEDAKCVSSRLQAKFSLRVPWSLGRILSPLRR
jgi:hypothetical protein